MTYKQWLRQQETGEISKLQPKPDKMADWTLRIATDSQNYGKVQRTTEYLQEKTKWIYENVQKCSVNIEKGPRKY